MYESANARAAATGPALFFFHRRPRYVGISYLFRVVYIYCAISKKSNRRTLNVLQVSYKTVYLREIAPNGQQGLKAR